MIAPPADLQAKRLLDQMLVVLGTEFGRTTRINGDDGRDHHDRACTWLLAGDGIEGAPARPAVNVTPGLFSILKSMKE